MKAIRVYEFGGAEVLRLQDVPSPSPGTGEMLIDVEAVGVNFVEIYQRTGHYQRAMPYTAGSEAAGVVRALGPRVSEFAVGDRVVSQSANGAYAEQTLMAASRSVKIPDGISTREAVAVCLQGMTAHYLASSTYPIKPGDRALVHAAAGGVGLLLCQIAKKRGAFVIGTASTPAKRALARKVGADEAIDYTATDFVGRVRHLTGGAGVHVVYDSVGRDTFAKSLDCLAPRGLVALFGQSSGPVPPVDPMVLNKKGSLFLTRPTLDHYIASRDELLWRTTELFGWLRDGSLIVHIGAEFMLEHAVDAHRALEGRSTAGKVLLTP